jgi:hypothetical protein
MSETTEVGIHVSGDAAVLTGDRGLVESLMAKLDIDSTHVDRLGQGSADLLAQATGVAAVAAAIDGSWVRLTPESTRRLAELAQFNLSQDGLFSGVFRGSMGRIDSFAQFTTGGMNPVAMANLATLTATMALRRAVAQLEELAEAMDVKLDRLLDDNRAKALGDVQGLTVVLTRAFELYEATGRISETAWSQIAGHATSLAQASSHALAQIATMTQTLNAKSLAEKASAAESIAAKELRSWLVILAAAQANQQRLETLELVHVRQHDPDAVEAHAAAIRSAAANRSTAVTARVQELVDALTAAANVSDFNRVRSPQKSKMLLDSAERAVELIGVFAQIYGLDGLTTGEVERESWRKSLTDFAKTTGNVVSSGARAVPVGIAKVGGDAVIRVAGQIEAQRASSSVKVEPEERRRDEVVTSDSPNGDDT